ncbi:hypothetical protein FN960_17625 [Alkalicoccobacillus porphyridii]|uniref:GNAT family N-acetyltransferase n=1 Tax=Alkalicoccobacillus porphyridii TaxID=2597270 RepID=A0A553ZUK6_9BACI|nr:hypothetical protein FN960_17625 [Alkalicoccobacillus porphyridii]
MKKEAEYEWPQESISDSEYELIRMQQNMKEIAKDHKVLGIEQTKEEKWVIVSQIDDGHTCQIMIHTCSTAYDGHWDFAIQAEYYNSYSLHIDDIKGEENRGFGSICMQYLKEHAGRQNIQQITGDVAKRDWSHLDRLIYFYQKHHFKVDIDYTNQSGSIYSEVKN